MSGATGGADDDMIGLQCKGDPRTLAAKRSALVQYCNYFENSSMSCPVVQFDSELLTFELLETLIKFIDFERDEGVDLIASIEATDDDIEQLILAADFLGIQTATDSLMHDLFEDIEDQMKNLEIIPKNQLLKYLRLYPFLRGQEIEENILNLVPLSYYSLGYVKSFKGEFPNSVVLILASHMKTVINDVALLELEEENIYELLDSDHLRITEYEVLAVIKRWINHDYTERRESWDRLLECLRVDDSLTVDMVLDELTCNCKASCHCLTSTDFVMSFMEIQRGHSRGIKYPIKKTKRHHRTFKGPK